MSRTTIEMAREAGDDEWKILIKHVMKHFPSEFHRFVELVRADEREACAKVCDDLVPPCGYNLTETSFWDVTSLECAAAIRARGETSLRGNT